MSVAELFQEFSSNLRMGQRQRSSLAQRTERITRALNVEFRSTDSSSANRFYVGSMGRNTAIPTVSDVDLLYVLPYEAWTKYNAHSGNKQSSLLNAVRLAISTTYPTSRVSGDGQVVVIAFTDGVTYEVLPAFLNNEQGYTFADSNNGGSWKACKPKQEMSAFSTRNNVCNGNLVELCRMTRAWRDANNAPISGMLIDTLAYQFIEEWAHKNKSYLYYDYMTRDFFAFLASQNQLQQYWSAPGSGSRVSRKGLFEYKARQAELRALDAIQHLEANREWSAKQKFREIYGTDFPA